MVYGGKITGSLHIRDVVDLDTLQSIQDTFAEAMGFAAMIVDRDATPATKPSCFIPLCQIIRSSEIGVERCQQCDQEGGFLSQQTGGPEIYDCWGGLVDIAAPIVVNGEYLGSVHCGQVIPLSRRDEYLETILSRNCYLGLGKEELLRVAHKVPALSTNRIRAAAKLLFLLSNYIVEMGVINLTQAKLLEESQKQAVLQMELRRSQLNQLESQINPHFLFNTLSLIGSLAIQEQAPQTEEVACCLGDLLRHSLMHTGKKVALGEEIEIIQRYLNIQKLRFGARLVVEMEIDPWLYGLQIPCMLLQPLVENAIVHAVEPLSRVVRVMVRAREAPNGLLLEISDDGAGMEAETVQAIRSRSSTNAAETGGIGLQNVLHRLELEFGADFYFAIESKLNHGTWIRLILPLHRPPRPPSFYGALHARLDDH